MEDRTAAFRRRAKKKKEARKEELKNKSERIWKKLRRENKVSIKTIREIRGVYERIPTEDLRPTNEDCMFCAIMIVGSQLAKEPLTIREAQRVIFLKTEIGPHQNRHEINQKTRQIWRKLKIVISPTNSADYIDRFCKKIGLDKEIAETAKAIITDGELAGAIPPAIAAAGIKIASRKFGQEVTKQEMAEITGMSKVTIRVITRALEKQIEK